MSKPLITPSDRAFLRSEFVKFSGHPYCRRHHFAYLAGITKIPVVSITKFYYNDRRRNPTFYGIARAVKPQLVVIDTKDMSAARILMRLRETS